MIDFQQLASLALFLVLLLLGFILVLIAFIPISFGLTIHMLGRDRWFSLGLGAILLLCCFGLLSSGAFPKLASQTLLNPADAATRFGTQTAQRDISVPAGQAIDCIPMTSGAQRVPTLNIRNERSTADPAIVAAIQCPQANLKSGDSTSALVFLEDGGNSGLNQGWAKVRYEITGWVAKDRLDFSSNNQSPS